MRSSFVIMPSRSSGVGSASNQGVDSDFKAAAYKLAMVASHGIAEQ